MQILSRFGLNSAFDKLEAAQWELGNQVRAMLKAKGIVSVAAAAGVQSIWNMFCIIKRAKGKRKNNPPSAVFGAACAMGKTQQAYAWAGAAFWCRGFDAQLCARRAHGGQSLLHQYSCHVVPVGGIGQVDPDCLDFCVLVMGMQPVVTPAKALVGAMMWLMQKPAAWWTYPWLRHWAKCMNGNCIVKAL
jgi:hypothetical protein